MVDGSHRRRAMGARATQQTEKDSLGLVIAVMPQGEPVAGNAGKRGMTGDACGLFQSSGVIAGHFDSEYAQVDIAPMADPGTEILPFVSRRAESVMNVRGLQRISEPLPQGIEHIEQHGRINPPGECATQAVTGIDTRCGQYRGCDLKYDWHGLRHPGAHGPQAASSLKRP
jgi:hypothetical protein